MHKFLTSLFSAAALTLPAWAFAADGEESLFDRLDTNKDGVLSLDEVDEDKKRLFERLLRSGDKDQDGKLNREEFLVASQPAANPNGEPVRPSGGPALEGRPDPKEAFRRLDGNGDGKLSREEVPERMRENFDRIDANRDGSIDQEELGRAFEAMARLAGGRPGQPGQPGGQRPDRRSMEQMFDRQDRNGDGKLTHDEMPPERGEMFENMLDRFDKDGDSALNQEEFVKALSERFEREMAERPMPPGDPGRPGSPERRPMQGPPIGPLMAILDSDRNGEISKEEIANAATALAKLDRNGDGTITRDELAAAGGVPRPDGRAPDARRPEGDRPAERRPESDRPVERRPEGDRQQPRRLEAVRPAGARGAGTPEAMLRRLKEGDKNGDGKIGKDEVPEEFLRGGFARLDSNSDGFIDEAELKQAEERLRENPERRQPSAAEREQRRPENRPAADDRPGTR